MNKKEFLEELREHLVGIEDIKDILEDYEEHFRMGKKNERKESEIAKSLGEPKQIARDLRRELNDENVSLKTSLIELWIDAKKIVKRSWKDFSGALDDTSEKFNEFVNAKNKKSKSKEKDITKRKISVWKTTLLLFLNLFIVIWIVMSIYIAIISLFVAGISIWISGLAVVISSLLILISPTSQMLSQLSVSGVFAGAGVIFLGSLWIYGATKLTAGFSWLVKKYFKLNRRLSRK